MCELYPLRFKEILRNYRFGARWIESAFEKSDLPDDHALGETWEVCDRPGESSEVVNGPLAGRTLGDLIDTCGEQLLGGEIVARFGHYFPLLIKLLDASSKLGEQAHHNDQLARAEGLDDPGKTEAWYMLYTKPGATVDCGHVNDLTRTQLVDAILDGSVIDRMNRYTVKPGDAFLLYAGAMHHSLGGLLFYEIMQNSDVYISLSPPSTDLPDDRRHEQANIAANGVHLEDNVDYRARPVTLDIPEGRHTYVTACQHFALERLDLTGAHTLNCIGRCFYVITTIEGAASITTADHSETLRPGQTCMLPAAIGEVTVAPEAATTAILKAYVPDLLQDIVTPLRDAGIPDASIAALGAKTKLNPIATLLS